MTDHLIWRLRGHQPYSGGIDIHDAPALVHTDRIGTEFHQPAVSFLGQAWARVQTFDVPQRPLSSHAALFKSSAQRLNRSCARRSPGTGRVSHLTSSYRLRVPRHTRLNKPSRLPAMSTVCVRQIVQLAARIGRQINDRGHNTSGSRHPHLALFAEPYEGAPSWTRSGSPGSSTG